MAEGSLPLEQEFCRTFFQITFIDSRTRGSWAKPSEAGSRPFMIYPFHGPPGKRPKAASA
jgi:hypothetical protein